MNRFTWRGKEVSELVHKVAMEALHTGGETILTEAMNNVPRQSGTLRRSGVVTIQTLPDPKKVYETAQNGDVILEKTISVDDSKVFVSYNTPYAVKQHEDMDLQHTDGGPKYLENAFNQQKDKIVQYVEQQVDKELRRR